MQKKSRFKNGLSFWCAVYPAVIAIGLMIWLLRLVGWIRVRGHENLSRNKGPMLLVSNHPSLWEPIILPGFFFPQCLIHPIKCIPWETPDQQNYTNTWYWGVFGARFISVPRGNRRGELRALVEMIKVLRIGCKVVLFPEGGRTSKGNRFVPGKRMRELKNGVGKIVNKVNCTVVPVWIDGAEEILPVGTWFPRFWRRMDITFGRPFHSAECNGGDAKQNTKYISDRLLETAG